MVKILHLFPKLMNLYGDYANVTVLKRHLEDQGQKVIVDKKDIGDLINFDEYDFIYMGSGTESNQIIALNELKKYVDSLEYCIVNNKVFLFTGNAMELFGKSIDEHEGLDLFDFIVKHTDKRHSGDVIVNNNEIGDVVGFINRSSQLFSSEDNTLFNYVFKDSNIIDGTTEGYRFNNLFCTHIIGPVLVKNPNFMKYIVKLLLPKDCKYKDIDYPFEKESYTVTLNSLKDRIK